MGRCGPSQAELLSKADLEHTGFQKHAVGHFSMFLKAIADLDRVLREFADPS